MKLFKNFFKEENMAGTGGVFGNFEGGGAFSSDFYAPGSAIIPGILGTYSRKGKVKVKKKKRNRKRSKKKNHE